MANEMSRERCLEALGLAPGASAQELKAAYRDMAKVWHPDRFTHDPRLQQKAQERLKEINDAYRQLLAGNFDSHRARSPDDSTRDTRTHSTTHAQHAQHATKETSVAVRSSPRKVGRLVLIPALAFGATFALVTPRLLSSRRRATPTAAESAAQSSRETQTEDSRDQSGGAAMQKSPRKQTPTGVTSRTGSVVASNEVAAATTPVRALPTITVRVDPSTGLLARADCPHKMPMTFPAGDEPRAYCNAEHRAAATARQPATEDAAQEKKSRLKSFAGRVASPTKWFGKDSQSEPAKKRSTGDNQ